MPEFVWDQDTGARYYRNDDGTLTAAPETGMWESMLVDTGAQFETFGRGIGTLAAQALGNEEWESDLLQRQAAADELMAPLREEYPIATGVGRALPALATAPLSASGVAGNLALQAGLGAAEGLIDLDASDSSQADNALYGAGFGIVGDMAGRMLGRVYNLAKGLAGDIVLPRNVAVNPAAEAWEEVGGRTLAYQRMQQGTAAQRLAERSAQGAQASINPPRILGEVSEANEKLYRDTAIEAVGLDPRQFDDLGPEFVDEALNRFNREFEAMKRLAGTTGDLQLSDEAITRLMNTGQIRKLRQVGMGFENLDDGIISGTEYVTARQALMEDAANAFKGGEPTWGEALIQIVDQLDSQVAERLPREFLPDFARLREQYRVFSILERPGVISNSGQLNPRALNRGLQSRAQGFGRTATRGANAVNPESTALLEVARRGDNPNLASFRSSGTAENLALDNAMRDAQAAGVELLSGNPAGALGFVGRLMAPNVVGMAEAGSGRAYQGLVNAPGRVNLGPLNLGAPGIGGAAGRGVLDELFYPFVGDQDERSP